jgi:hypothetical protein
VIFGARLDEKFEGSIRLIAVVTGIAELAEDLDDGLLLSPFTI